MCSLSAALFPHEMVLLAPDPPLHQEEKMSRSVAGCSIFKRRCNLPTIADAAECRGWVLDRRICLTERRGRKSRRVEKDRWCTCFEKKLKRRTNVATATGLTGTCAISSRCSRYKCPHNWACWIKKVERRWDESLVGGETPLHHLRWDNWWSTRIHVHVRRHTRLWLCTRAKWICKISFHQMP